MATSAGNAGGEMPVGLYDATYGGMSDALYSEIRREVWDEDLGQASWLTAAALDALIPWLKLGPGSRVLDVACGSGGNVARVAERTGAAALGVDVHESAIDQARTSAWGRALGERGRFIAADGSQPLPLEDGSFSAIMCIDAINHLAGRAEVLKDWRRLLVPGGRLVFTDPVVITGAVEASEIAARSSVGRFVFTPPGLNERLLERAGFAVLDVRDETGAVAAIARRWAEARQGRESQLVSVEGRATFDGQQAFLRVCGRLADERRLSRFLYVAGRL